MKRLDPGEPFERDLPAEPLPAMPPGWLDRVLLRVAPQWALRRLRARVMAGSMARSHRYEAAAHSRRTAEMHAPSGDANAGQGWASKRMRNRARDLVRNNGWARRAVSVTANDIVGWGIMPAVDGDGEVARRALKIWNRWAGSTECDRAGRMPLVGLQRLAAKQLLVDGEGLAIRHRSWAAGIPLKIELLDADYLDESRDGLQGEAGGPIINGVEYDAEGQRAAYWLFEQHPDAYRVPMKSTISRRVPAEDVLHFFKMDRPEQARGVTQFASTIAKYYALNGYDDAALEKMRMASAMAAFVTDDGSSAHVGAPLSDLLEGIETGGVHYLRQGQTVTFSQPPVDSGYEAMGRRGLQQIAAGHDLTYEALSGDYSRVNFSSARMGALTHWSSIWEWQWDVMIPQLCEGLWRWAMEAAAYQVRDVPPVTWTAPTQPMINPSEEGMAITRAVRSGIQTLAGALRERGIDPRQHLREVRRMNALLDEMDVVLDSDPRYTNGVGALQGAGLARGSAPPPIPDDAAPADDDDVEEMEDEGDLRADGPQVRDALVIVQKVAEGSLPRDAGLGMLQEFFQLSKSAAESVLGSAGQTPAPASPAFISDGP